PSRRRTNRSALWGEFRNNQCSRKGAFESTLTRLYRRGRSPPRGEELVYRSYLMGKRTLLCAPFYDPPKLGRTRHGSWAISMKPTQLDDLGWRRLDQDVMRAIEQPVMARLTK